MNIQDQNQTPPTPPDAATSAVEARARLQEELKPQIMAAYERKDWREMLELVDRYEKLEEFPMSKDQ